MYSDSIAALQGDRAERVQVGLATGNFFTALGIQPRFGRNFAPGEDVRGEDGAALLTRAAWLKFADVRMSRAVLGFAVTMVVLTTLAFGLAPALHSTRVDLSQSLKEGSSGSVASRGRLRSALVVAQVALSLVLLVGAGLLLRSFATLIQVGPASIRAGLSPGG